MSLLRVVYVSLTSVSLSLSLSMCICSCHAHYSVTSVIEVACSVHLTCMSWFSLKVLQGWLSRCGTAHRLTHTHTHTHTRMLAWDSSPRFMHVLISPYVQVYAKECVIEVFCIMWVQVLKTAPPCSMILCYHRITFVSQHGQMLRLWQSYSKHQLEPACSLGTCICNDYNIAD